MAEDRGQLPHKLTLNERQQLSMTGVTEVVSFDEDHAVLRTGLGTLLIQGQGLQLKQLSQEVGQVAVEGTVSALSYEEPRERSWLHRFLG